MEFAKGAAAFIGWLSGSLAALAGILYAFGYLVTLSNLHSLGLDSLVLNFDPFFFLLRGAKFVLYVTRLVFEQLLGPLFAFVVMASVLVLLRRFLGKFTFAQRITGAVRSALGKIRSWRGLLFAALLLLMFGQILPTYGNLTSLLTISDLLFEPCESGVRRHDAGTLDLCLALIHRVENSLDAEKLRTQFMFALFLFLEAGLVFYVAWRTSSGWKWRPFLVSPFAIVFLMTVVSLPMIFAVVVLKNEYSIVRVAGAADVPAERDFYLLNKTAREFVLWDGAERRVLWLPASKLAQAHIGRKVRLPLAGERRVK